MRKQRRPLELFLTALLPVAVLLIGFFTFSLKAALNSGESANPAASGDYYRSPGKDGMYFGPEIYSDTLNGGRFNNGFEIVFTNEMGSVYASSIPNAINWRRHQSWYFSTEHDAPPWGTTYSYIDLNDDLGWSEISSGGGTTGYPWAGYEMHYSDPDSTTVTGIANVTGYRQHTEDDGTKYICPMYYKTGTWVYTPQGSNLNLKFARKHEFGAPQFHEDAPDTLRRQVVAGELVGTWLNCIELN